LRQYFRELVANEVAHGFPNRASHFAILSDSLMADELSQIRYPDRALSEAETADVAKRRAAYERFVVGMTRRKKPGFLPDFDRINQRFAPVVKIGDPEAEIERRAILDVLPPEKLRTVLALGRLTWACWFAWDAYGVHLVGGGDGPCNLSDPGNTVEVIRVRADNEAAGRAKATAGKTLGAMLDFFGVPRTDMTQALIQAVTGICLSKDELIHLAKTDLRCR
jgi:hypothetical protein